MGRNQYETTASTFDARAPRNTLYNKVTVFSFLFYLFLKVRKFSDGGTHGSWKAKWAFRRRGVAFRDDEEVGLGPS